MLCVNDLTLIVNIGFSTYILVEWGNMVGVLFREWAITNIMVLINMAETFIRGDGYTDCGVHTLLYCAFYWNNGH